MNRSYEAIYIGRLTHPSDSVCLAIWHPLFLVDLSFLIPIIFMLG